MTKASAHAASGLWQELGDGVFRRRYEFLDQNIGLVVGGEAVLLVDSRSHPGHAREVLSEVRLVTPLPVGWIFNTHYHWDHAFGNQVFDNAVIWGHVACREELIQRGLARIDELAAAFPPEADEFRKVIVSPPTEIFDDRATIDLGNRTVAVSHHGRGHTNSDAALRVDDVTFAGDLVEEGGPPGFSDSFPIAWFDTVGRLAAESGATVVPGHGDVVDVEYLVVARFDLGWIAQQAQKAWSAGRPVEEIDLGGSPYPDESAREALQRAYLELEESGPGSKFSQ